MICEFLSDVPIIGIDDSEVEASITIRRRNPTLKLPDAVIAATAIALAAPLVTRDDQLLRLVYPGLETLSIF
ncbi:PIN domain-containing protein [Breznakiellaceae bacterium SP9]